MISKDRIRTPLVGPLRLLMGRSRAYWKAIIMYTVEYPMRRLRLETCAGGRLLRIQSGPASMHLILEILARRACRLASLEMKTA